MNVEAHAALDQAEQRRADPDLDVVRMGTRQRTDRRSPGSASCSAFMMRF